MDYSELLWLWTERSIAKNEIPNRHARVTAMLKSVILVMRMGASMKKLSLIAGLASLLALSPALTADDGLEFHDDYYLGFSQGAYYGLMLAGVDYNVAWCMKSELAYAAASMGTGGAFQAKIEQMLVDCREELADDE